MSLASLITRLFATHYRHSIHFLIYDNNNNNNIVVYFYLFREDSLTLFGVSLKVLKFY